MNMNKLHGVVGVAMMLVMAFAQNVYAAECTVREKSSVARAIGTRDVAYIKLQIARAQVDIETAYQAQLTSAMEAKYASVAVGSYVESVRPIIKEKLDKELEKAKKERTRASTRAIESKKKAVESALKKHNTAANKVPVLNCTILN